MFCMLYIEKYLCIRRCRMNTFLELAKSRHSVRSYEKRAVEAEKLNSILEAGRIAPTAANMQPCRFLVLNDDTAMSKLQKACTPHGAPLAIVVCVILHIKWQIHTLTYKFYNSISDIDLQDFILKFPCK